MPKRLCVFSDGTWCTPEKDVPTNIMRLATSVTYCSPTGVPQIVFYDPGVGCEGNVIDRVKGGTMGDGIDLNIKQLYTFILMNYEDGDELMLFGFSRGAYTVRSLAGLLHESGLVPRDRLDLVQEAYDLYRTNGHPDNHTASSFRARHSRRVPVTLLLCFDTVGALGVPPGLMPVLDWFRGGKYQFHDTTLNENINHAVHVLSVDEDRKGFLPTYMNPHPKRGSEQLTQVFLPGHHSGVGGGSAGELALSDNALHFVISEIKRRGLELGLNPTLVPQSISIPTAPLLTPPLEYRIVRFFTGRQARNIKSADMLHESVLTVYREFKAWRPDALKKFHSHLDTVSTVANKTMEPASKVQNVKISSAFRT